VQHEGLVFYEHLLKTIFEDLVKHAMGVSLNMCPCDYKDYPSDWKQIVKQRRKEVSDKCELCFAPNHSMVVRPTADKYPWFYAHENHSTKLKPVKIILTLHHIKDGNKMDVRRQNLILLCQRCHLRLDLLHHMEKRNGAIQERMKI
jgi:hypothetical protein